LCAELCPIMDYKKYLTHRLRAVFFFSTALIIPLITVLFPNHAFAQQLPAAEVHAIVQKLSDGLTGKYPFPEISIKYAAMLKRNEPQYRGILPNALIGRITNDLQSVHKDVHLQLYLEKERDTSKSSRMAAEKQEREQLEKGNYGFRSVQLDNFTSSAYIDIPYGFNCTQEGFEMAAAAMAMAAYSHYIIIDLRGNPGGAGGMGHFLASYFFEPGEEKFYLNGFEKDRNHELQEYTYGYVPGKRLTNSKLFVLTDRHTGSAAEGFAFAMQKMKRATIVGDTTIGAGIASVGLPLGHGISVLLPVKMVVAPGTSTGWEGTGVFPDVAVNSENAREKASKLILEDLIRQQPSGEKNELLQWRLDDAASAEFLSCTAAPADSALAGDYSAGSSMVYENGKLVFKVMINGSLVPLTLFPFLKDVYALSLPGHSKATGNRLFILRSPEGKVTAVQMKWIKPGGGGIGGVAPFQRL
jgi:hypothetical protein